MTTREPPAWPGGVLFVVLEGGGKNAPEVRPGDPGRARDGGGVATVAGDAVGGNDNVPGGGSDGGAAVEARCGLGDLANNPRSVYSNLNFMYALYAAGSEVGGGVSGRGGSSASDNKS